MKPRRIVVPALSLSDAQAGQTQSLPSSYRHYLLRVLRLQMGQSIELCDGKGTRWLAELSHAETEALQVTLTEALSSHEDGTVESSVFSLYLAQAMPKSDRMEWVLQKSTELGVAGFFPFFSKRCVVQLEPKRQANRMARWQRILEESARQSERAHIPVLEEPVNLPELLEQLPPALPRIVCWEKETETSLKSWMQAHPTLPGLVVFVGPEGGWAPPEIELMRSYDICPVGLGPLILRTETVGPALCAILQFSYGALGGYL